MTTMSSDPPTNVCGYLFDIDKYLKGDLKTFHELCTEYETKIAAQAKEEIERAAKDLDFLEAARLRDEYMARKKNLEMATPSPHGYQPPENEEEVFNLTIPITLMLFAVVDVVGYLVREEGRHTDTRGNFEAFLNFTKSSLSLSEVDNDLLFKKDLLLKRFRHGIVHGCFPKLWRGVSYRSTNKSKPLFFQCKGYETLNVNRLKDIVIATFDHIRENKELHPRMECRYKCLIDLYQKEERGENTKEFDFGKCSSY